MHRKIFKRNFVQGKIFTFKEIEKHDYLDVFVIMKYEIQQQ
jgi:hypothetical protein